MPDPPEASPDSSDSLNDTPIQIHVPAACMERARSRGVLPGDEKVKPWINKSKKPSAGSDAEVGAAAVG